VEVSDGLLKDHFIGKLRSKGGRKGRCLDCNKFGHHAKECPKGRDTSLDEDNNHSMWTSSMIKGMTGNAGNEGNGRLFKESKEPQNLFYVPDYKKNWCPSRKWKSKVSGWHSSMERYVFENIFFKDVFEFRVVSSPLGTMSIDSEPKVCESDGDWDA